jgi:hypothetical protein
MPLGHICLDITFGQPDNFHREPLTFKVVNFLDIYNALLVCPCFAKFMAIPNYTYLKLKMPGPKGVITVEGSFEQATATSEITSPKRPLSAPTTLPLALLVTWRSP